VGISVAQVGRAMAMAAPADVVLALSPALGIVILVGLMALCAAAVASAGLSDRWQDASRWLRRRLAAAEHRAHCPAKHLARRTDLLSKPPGSRVYVAGR